jgi:hypothetical protein
VTVLVWGGAVLVVVVVGAVEAAAAVAAFAEPHAAKVSAAMPNAHARKAQRVVGALRRLATEAVVMSANVTHAIALGFAIAGAAGLGTASGRPAVWSIAAIDTRK